jgi:hypothetical protein
MAKIDRYYFGSNLETDYNDFLNVSEVVGGPDGINLPGDVMVVQALLLFMGEFWRGFPDKECPAVTGAFNRPTREAIKKYQRIHNRDRIKTLGRLVTDGRVSPARGRLNFGGGHYTWTIVTLNFWACIAAKASPVDDEMGYVNEILERWPQLRGALHLPLDESPAA